MFNITNRTESIRRNRFLENIAEVPREKYGRMAMNISDLNTTMFEMYIIPWNHREDANGFKLYKLNFTWECVYF